MTGKGKEKRVRSKAFKNGKLTLGEIRRAVNADKPSGIFKPVARGRGSK